MVAPRRGFLLILTSSALFFNLTALAAKKRTRPDGEIRAGRIDRRRGSGGVSAHQGCNPGLRWACSPIGLRKASKGSSPFKHAVGLHWPCISVATAAEDRLSFPRKTRLLYASIRGRALQV